MSNVVLLMSDEHNPFYSSVYGHSFIQTPHMQALADRGTVFENTYCPSCTKLLIRRRGFVVEENRMKGSTCPFCSEPIPGVWEDNPPSHTTGMGIPLPVVVSEGPCG